MAQAAAPRFHLGSRTRRALLTIHIVAGVALLGSVILAGALLIGPTVTSLADGSDASEGVLIAAVIWDIVALTLATTLGVFKPRRAG